jgi:ribosomal protein S18 acetylase RimI-like enzyme
MLKIREARSEDIADVLRLYAQPDFDNGKVLPIEEARGLYARFLEYTDYCIYLAEIDGRIVGTFALLIMINLGHCGTPSAIIEDVVVDPDLQGRGFGRDMMLAAMEMAREKKCYKLVLSSNARRVRAHAFYESLGFERHGVSCHITL